jgi:cytochrome c oxidase accessory protein FixG
VCPTGIDIRDGSQLECIQCALCIDACNEIMTRVGRPKNLIAYDTIAGQEAAAKGTTAPLRLLRPRTLLYAGMICFVSAIMLVALLMRTTLEINVLHDRNPPFVTLSDGAIRNGYTIKILNKLHQPREFALQADGLPGARLTVVGVEAGTPIRVRTDDLRELKVFVTLPASEIARSEGGMLSYSLIVKDIESGSTTSRSVHFQMPPTRR